MKVRNTTVNTVTGGNAKNKSLLAEMIICIILTISGVAFGIYGMIQKSDNKQATSAGNSIVEENNTSASDSTTERKNSIISVTAPKRYGLSFESLMRSINNNGYHMQLGIRKGDISIYGVYTRTTK